MFVRVLCINLASGVDGVQWVDERIGDNACRAAGNGMLNNIPVSEGVT